MNRMAAFVYGTLCYLLFLATSLYSVAFLGNFGASIEASMELRASPSGKRC